MLDQSPSNQLHHFIANNNPRFVISEIFLMTAIRKNIE